ncbi:family 43 glycosylhydrolase [Halobacteria archaeon HArc-gm2]|nr:family 43 glycosylhydrolase [Halobacteria archaeon HArc-gm2]
MGDEPGPDANLGRRSVLKSLGAGTLAAGALGLSGAATADQSPDHYHNPVGPVGFGDVTAVQADDGTYYVYGTETPNDVVPIATSEDLVNWSYVGAALQSQPDWRNDPDAGVWAPDVTYYDGQYHLYYSYSTWGSQDNPGIGLATSPTPEGPFTDQGPVFRAEDLGMTNCIDSEFRVVDGTPYMVWGSWYGIHGVELTPDGRDYVPGTTFHLAGDMREGGMIVEANGYYYLFYSTGHCCEGADSTYAVEVGRSESFTGPYYNQNGTDLRELNEHHSGVSVLAGTDQFVGPGHNTAIQDDAGDWWLLYHVEATTDLEERQLMVDRIQWDANDWPVVACDGTPSSQSPMPASGDYPCSVGSGSGGTGGSSGSGGGSGSDGDSGSDDGSGGGGDSGSDGGGGSDGSTGDGPIEAGTYRITNGNSGKLLEVAFAGTADGDNVRQYGDTGHACQQWEVTENGDGTYTVVNAHSGKLLEVANADTSDGANVRQYADTGHACQRWSIEATADGQYRFVNAHSGQVAEVASAGTADGDDVQQWPDNGGDHQRWTLLSV